MLAVILLAAQLAGAVPCPPAAIPDLSVSEWSRNIATVRSKYRRGQGLVVGWEPRQAWVAVPAHVVFDVNRPANPASYADGLEIRLAGDEEPRPLCTTTGGQTNPRPPQQGSDLTFVCVQWTGQPLFTMSLPAREARIGNDVRLLRSDARRLDGKVTALSNDAGDGLLRTTFSGVESMSGSPVASPAGIVGLYLGTHESGGRVLPIATVQTKAQGGAQIPWQLVENEYFDCNRTRRVCMQVERGITPPSVELRSLFSPGSAALTTGACADVPEGKYQIVPGHAALCEPQYVSIHSAAAPLSLKLECAPVLTGTWHTPDGDWFICLDNSVGTVSCSGLTRLGLGLLQATLSANGARVAVSGAFVSPNGMRVDASGSLVWMDGRLTGEIRRERQLPKSIELSREDTP